MKNRILHLLLVCFTGTLAAQADFSAAAIPSSLLKNADVVVRQYDLKFEVLNKGEAIHTEHKVLTLLNENAASENDRVFTYDKINIIEDIEGAIYDGGGKLVRRIKKKDIFDYKESEHYVNDTRRKVIQFSRLPFPYTIEYTVVTKLNGLLFYPFFYPQESAAESVESASLEIIMPEGLEARIYEVNLPEGSKTGKLRWNFKNILAFVEEPFVPKIQLPAVLSAPSTFTMEGYEGDLSTWKSFGAFIGKLNAGKDVLSPETVTKLKALTADCPDARCKTERIYALLQESTRYFFIALGIGGWQPMSAREVDQFKYSDCKGLSNYTVSMLHAVDVPAYYTLIRAGINEQKNQYPDFPNPRFNHVFACVPLGKDTMWLECTDQSGSCGFLSYNTDDRPALVITPEGGKLVQTPKYDEHSNTVRRETQVELQPDGSAVLRSSDVYKGLSSMFQAELSELHSEIQKKALYENLSLSDFEIKSIDFKMLKGRLPEAQRTLELSVPKFASASGKRLFVPVLALAPKITPTATDSIRKYPVQVTTRGFTMEDYLTIVIPEGYTLENAVTPLSYTSPFGTYELSIKNEPGGRLLIYRKLMLNNSIQPKEQFETLVNFFKNIAKADKTKLVLAKGT